jgi:GT2 family glycosyltransferase
MDVSVIIVNYNVKYFLFNCLHSVQKAMQHVNTEVFVIDNNSTDASIEMIKQNFSFVKLIENKNNVGFSKANNQGIRQASGKYVLLLNPDTIIEENTLKSCFDFMEANPEAGGLGVKMIDGKGHFLPESKRGLPKPDVAFYKITGINKLFPNSKKFNGYYLGNLSNNETHEIEILSGAFMFMRLHALHKTDLLDEDFFMYGEDIDLSYRIIKVGYKNYYYPHTQIIHYKGESTKKSSINYVMVFYRAMEIFAKKHFTKKTAGYYSLFIQLAIWLRAGVSIIKRIIDKVLLPLTDFLLIYAFTKTFTFYYEHIVRFPNGGHYPAAIVTYSLLWFAALVVLFCFFAGTYDKPYSYKKLFNGIFVSGIFILVVYSLLPENLRFSRAVIFFSLLGILTVIPFYRFLLSKSKFISIGGNNKKRIAVVASEKDAEEIATLIKQTYYPTDIICFVKPEKYTPLDSSSIEYSGNFNHLFDLIQMYRLNEIIFSPSTTSYNRIISTLEKLSVTNSVKLKIASINNKFMVGSSSILSDNEYFYSDLQSVLHPAKMRSKRILDITLAFLFILLSPIIAIITGRFKNLLHNLLNILVGKYSFVGLYPIKLNQPQSKIKTGILTPIENEMLLNLKTKDIISTNVAYARNYSVLKDIIIIMRSINQLSKKAN